MQHPPPPRALTLPHHRVRWFSTCCAGALLAGAWLHSVAANAAEPAHAPGAHVPAAHAAPARPAAVPPATGAHTTPSGARTSATLSLEQDAARIAANVRAAMARATARHKETPLPTRPSPVDPHTARQAAAQGHATPHWGYGESPNGPAAWGQLSPQYSTCATGQRQSPIHIDDSVSLQGPAEALKLEWRPSGGSVVNNGHTVQVDVESGNSLTVRGRRYELVQFHFHHPAEEKVNHRGFAMVAHLVHRDTEGGLAVVAVLLEPGAANALIDRVWTHMPLEANDRVPLPAGALDLAQLMPQDPRYYQFMGSLTTPPCTEGVLWMVMQQPMTLSHEQLRLFARLFPHNARPVQPVNGRVVRQGM